MLVESHNVEPGMPFIAAIVLASSPPELRTPSPGGRKIIKRPL